MQPVPPWATLFTSMFLHGGWMHLISNMLFLWIFGNNIEDLLGKFRYLLLYLASGVAAALIQGFRPHPRRSRWSARAAPWPACLAPI